MRLGQQTEHVWTADGADSADWEAAPGAGGGTTVVANPAGTDGDDLTRVSIAGTNYVIPEGGGVGSGPETLFDNHPTFVQIGILASNVTSTITSLTLAALPTETVVVTDFLLIENEVIDISVVNGAVISGSRGQRGTLEFVHLAGTPVYLLTTTNGGLGRTLTTRTWAYGSSHQNAFDLGKVLAAADDDGKRMLNRSRV